MAAPDFYQTFYQDETLFRIPGERWQTSTTPSDLIADLDEIAANTPETSTADSMTADTQTLAEPKPQLPEIESVEVSESAVDVSPDDVQAAENPQQPEIPKLQNPNGPTTVQHKVLLLADAELQPADLLFLEKILQAVNLNIDGVDLLNLNGHRNVDFAQLVTGKHIHHFITFGVPFTRVHLDITLDRYHPVRFFGINFLLADSLPVIEADVHLKRRLWSALKQLFLQ